MIFISYLSRDKTGKGIYHNPRFYFPAVLNLLILFLEA